MTLESYTLTIRSLPDWEEESPQILRLRHALKYLLRACGFRCMTIRPQDPVFSDGDGI